MGQGGWRRVELLVVWKLLDVQKGPDVHQPSKAKHDTTVRERHERGARKHNVIETGLLCMKSVITNTEPK